MKALLDIGATQWESLGDDVRPFVAGQLLTPLTRYTRWAEEKFAVDNGAVSKKQEFDRSAFKSLLEREREHVKKCLFVCIPDVKGDARRTLEIYFHRREFIPDGWPLAFVCQDGAENHTIPWSDIAAVFIAGTTEWKMSKYAAAIIRTATILNKHKHVGRVNTSKRWNHFEELGVDTCDGSGISRYRHMLKGIATRNDHPLFEESVNLLTQENGNVSLAGN